LVAFYDLNVNEDSYFWSAKKVTKNTTSDMESFVELVGGVSSGERTLPTEDSNLDHYKRRSTEFSNAVDMLVANKEQSMVPIIKSSIVKSAMQEGAKEQTRVMLGQDVDPETPLFEGGLIASPDGLGWSLPA
jgi:halogenation protein CepH